ncbi:checkpoint serine/threonine-protein kinase [Vigna unguiculata]|uniref:Checkpoint serine/threonine-protein kinase n=1 Tax=Vigna unguiculata TaxID=3917 RepID=A0A4D6LLF2_VIGUN|nr:checkpoint serine/threonine-protein kinase [Vigna unguiculata]
MVPQRLGTRAGGATPSTFIPVFVDEECQDSQSTKEEGLKCPSLKIKQEDDKELKRETELLRKNPLRNFPQNSLPR